MGTLEMLYPSPGGLRQVVTHRQVSFHQVYNDFRVRIGAELHSLCRQLFFEGDCVLNDAIVDHHNFPRCAHMGMSVSGGGLPVGCPARVANASVTVDGI